MCRCMSPVQHLNAQCACNWVVLAELISIRDDGSNYIGERAAVLPDLTTEDVVTSRFIEDPSLDIFPGPRQSRRLVKRSRRRISCRLCGVFFLVCTVKVGARMSFLRRKLGMNGEENMVMGRLWDQRVVLMDHITCGRRYPLTIKG